MTRNSLILAVAPVVLLLGFAAPARAFDPVTDYLITQAFDEFILEPAEVHAGWKPDVNRMQQRLAQLEKDAALRIEVREEIGKLRARLDDSASLAQLKALKSQFGSELGQINGRLNDHDDELERHDVQIADIKNGTDHASDPVYFVTRGNKQLADKKHYIALADARVAITLNPDKAEPYILQGQTYAAMGAQPGVARICYDQAVKVAPQYAPA